MWLLTYDIFLQLGVTLLGVCVLGFYVSVQARGSAVHAGVASENFTTPLIPISRNDKWRKNSQSCQDLVNYTCPAGEFFFFFLKKFLLRWNALSHILHCNTVLVLFPSLRYTLPHPSGYYTDSFRNFEVFSSPSFRLLIIFYLKYWSALFPIPQITGSIHWLSLEWMVYVLTCSIQSSHLLSPCWLSVVSPPPHLFLLIPPTLFLICIPLQQWVLKEILFYIQYCNL